MNANHNKYIKILRDIQSHTENKILSKLEYKMFDSALELVYNIRHS